MIEVNNWDAEKTNQLELKGMKDIRVATIYASLLESLLQSSDQRTLQRFIKSFESELLSTV